MAEKGITLVGILEFFWGVEQEPNPSHLVCHRL